MSAISLSETVGRTLRLGFNGTGSFVDFEISEASRKFITGSMKPGGEGVAIVFSPVSAQEDLTVVMRSGIMSRAEPWCEPGMGCFVMNAGAGSNFAFRIDSAELV